jgi:hypothetical protein
MCQFLTHALQQAAHSRSQPIVCGFLLIDVLATNTHVAETEIVPTLGARSSRDNARHSIQQNVHT